MQDEEMLLALYSLSPGRRLTSILLLLSPFLSPASCSCRRPLLSKPNRNSFSRWTSRARCFAAMRSRPSPRSSCWPRTGSGTRCRRIPSLTRCVPCAVRRTVASRVCLYEHWKFDEVVVHLVARCSFKAVPYVLDVQGFLRLHMHVCMCIFMHRPHSSECEFSSGCCVFAARKVPA